MEIEMSRKTLTADEGWPYKLFMPQGGTPLGMVRCIAEATIGSSESTVMWRLNLGSDSCIGSIDLEILPGNVEELFIHKNQLKTDPMDSHLFAVAQDQYPTVGRYRRPLNTAMGDPPGGEISITSTLKFSVV